MVPWRYIPLQLLKQRRSLQIFAGHDLARPIQSYLSRSSDPFLNLSIEHHLLQRTHPSSTILFFYINRPCVVIGRNQNPWTEVNLPHLRSFRSAGPDASGRVETGVELVRRRSGGGTVFHDSGNVNWSVICPSDVFTRDKHAEMVVRGLRGLGIARSRVNQRHDVVLDLDSDGTTSSQDGHEQAPNLDTHTTPWAGKGPAVKVSGSAYKLTRGRALHHGTALLHSENIGRIKDILTAPGKHFIQSKGVESVSSPVGNLDVRTDDFVREVHSEFGKLYGDVQLKEVNENWLQDEEVRKGFEELKSLEWVYGQTPRFSIATSKISNETEDSLPPFQLNVRNGIMESWKTESARGASSGDGTSSKSSIKLYEVESWHDVLADWDLRSVLISEEVSRLSTWLTEHLPPSHLSKP